MPHLSPPSEVTGVTSSWQSHLEGRDSEAPELSKAHCPQETTAHLLPLLGPERCALSDPGSLLMHLTSQVLAGGPQA